MKSKYPTTRSLFNCRRDVYAVAFKKKDGSLGFTPACKHAGKNSCNHKCKTCLHQRSLTDDVLKQHFSGEILIGIYLLLPDNTVCSNAVDFDDHGDEDKKDCNPLSDAKRYRKAARKLGIPCYIERSKSGKGYHVWTFFKNPLPACKARRLAEKILAAAGISETDTSFCSFFPKQDKLPEGGLGNLIALPFWGKAKKKGNSVFLDPKNDWEPYKSRNGFYTQINTVREKTVDAIIADNRGSGNQDNNSELLKVTTLAEDNWLIETLKGVEKGKRNTTAARLAGHYVSKKLPLAEVKLRMSKWNEKNRPPLETRELGGVIESIYSKDKLHREKYYGNKISISSSDAKLRLEILSNEIKENPKTAFERITNDNEILDALRILKDNDRVSFEEFWNNLRGIGVTSREKDSIKSAIKDRLRINTPEQGPEHDGDPVLLKDYIADAPVSDGTLIPSGWHMDERGVFSERTTKRGIEKDNISHKPIIIQGRLKDISDGSEYTRVGWLEDDKWKFINTERLNIADAKSLVKLSNFGFPVTSVTASQQVGFLSDYESVNSQSIPIASVTHQLGWHSEGKTFLYGKNVISESGEFLEDADANNMAFQGYPDNFVFFKGHDEGEDKIAEGFYKKGKFSEWSSVISLTKKFPLVTFSIFVSLSAPLLEILDAPIFIVDWSYRTSRGKTTTLKIAASCWGNPDEKSTKSTVKSWNATRVWMERASSVLHSLPLILDDTKRSKNPILVSQLIYDLASGQGRGRGSIQGMRKSSTWRTIVLSNGESKAVNFTAGDGGAHARVLSIWGSPFGTKSKKKAKLIRKITKIIHKNFGHAGLRFVQYLIKNKERWPEWRNKYAELIKEYQNRANSNEVAFRQSEYFAVIHLAAILAKKALKIDINYKKHLSKVFDKAIAESSEADRSKEALQEVLSWVVSSKEAFWRPGRNDSSGAPFNGWLGRWNPDDGASGKNVYGKKLRWGNTEEDGNSELRSIAFMPNHLHKFLKTEGYEPKAVIRTWKDNGWLDVGGEKKGLTKKVSLDGDRARCYVIPPNVIKIFNK